VGLSSVLEARHMFLSPRSLQKIRTAGEFKKLTIDSQIKNEGTWSFPVDTRQ
jgi:hypothetical protein